MEQQPVAIVTGASRGIGRAIAVNLATCGFQVVVNFKQNSDRAASVVSEVEAKGCKAIAVQADVGEMEDHSRLASK